MNKGQKERMIAELERIAVALEKIVSFADRFGSHAANTPEPTPKTLPEPSLHPADEKASDEFTLENEDVVRKETAEQLRDIVAISETNLMGYARSGEFPASRKGRFWMFSSDEIIKKIKSCYARQKKYVPGNRLSFLYSVRLAQKDNPHAVFFNLSQMSRATRITLGVLNGWLEKGLKSYKLPTARARVTNTPSSITTKGTALVCFEDIIEFLQKGGQA